MLGKDRGAVVLAVDDAGNYYITFEWIDLNSLESAARSGRRQRSAPFKVWWHGNAYGAGQRAIRQLLSVSSTEAKCCSGVASSHGVKFENVSASVIESSDGSSS